MVGMYQVCDTSSLVPYFSRFK